MPRRPQPLPDLTRVVGTRAHQPCWLDVPPPGVEVLPGVPWGRFDEFNTPAFWRVQVWFDELAGASPNDSPTAYALGRSLDEEVAACLLGGYGIPAEVGLAAFARLAEAGILARTHAGTVGNVALAAELKSLLSAPLEIRGRAVRYRFARQKSQYLAGALSALADGAPPAELRGGAFRDWLLRLPGVGLKTASWITRNHLGSNDVAILDVHVVRAGRLMKVFRAKHRPDRDYYVMERRFLELARALGVRAAALDAVIWREMRGGGVIG